MATHGGTVRGADERADSRTKSIAATAADVFAASAPTQTANFRIESSTAGAFQSGGTVLGTLQYQICA